MTELPSPNPIAKPNIRDAIKDAEQILALTRPGTKKIERSWPKHQNPKCFQALPRCPSA